MTATAIRPTTIKIDTDTKERVKRLADARHRSSHWMILEAIRQSRFEPLISNRNRQNNQQIQQLSLLRITCIYRYLLHQLQQNCSITTPIMSSFVQNISEMIAMPIGKRSNLTISRYTCHWHVSVFIEFAWKRYSLPQTWHAKLALPFRQFTTDAQLVAHCHGQSLSVNSFVSPPMTSTRGLNNSMKTSAKALSRRPLSRKSPVAEAARLRLSK